MNTEKILQLLIDIFFILVLLSFLASGISIPWSLSTNALSDIRIFDIVIQNQNSLFYIPALFSLFLYGIFVWSIYRLKKTTRSLVNKKVFNTHVSINFKKAGTGFIIVGVGSIIGIFLTKLFFESKLEMAIEASPNSNFLLIIIGLFFFLFSHVLRIGKDLKEENELTV